MSAIDYEFHPIIEEFICDFVDENIDEKEKEAFEDLLMADNRIADYTKSCREGVKLLSLYRVFLKS